MSRSRASNYKNTALIGAVFFVALDRLFKVLTLQLWRFHPQQIFPWLKLVFSENRFVSFSFNLGFDPQLLIIPVLLFLIYSFFFLLRKQRSLEAFALVWIIFGAASNLYDRLAYGFVIDYLSLSYFTTFNIADAMISVATAGLIIYYLKNS